MNISTTQPAKPSFYDICINHKLNSQKLQEIATTSGVHWNIIEAMCNGTAVMRSDAEKVLAAFSQFTHCNWTISNVHVRVLPTFADLYELHQFDTASLSLQADVPVAVVDQMLCDYPVPVREARSVLQTLSSQTRHNYTLENVLVKLSDGELQHD